MFTKVGKKAEKIMMKNKAKHSTCPECGKMGLKVIVYEGARRFYCKRCGYIEGIARDKIAPVAVIPEAPESPVEKKGLITRLAGLFAEKRVEKIKEGELSPP
jgi:ribosomal protein S27AE